MHDPILSQGQPESIGLSGSCRGRRWSRAWAGHRRVQVSLAVVAAAVDLLLIWSAISASRRAPDRW